MEKKRKQHFVWEYYLRPWAVEGQVACLRNKKLFSTSTENILQRRDFYRLSLVDEKIINITINIIKQIFPSKNAFNA